MLCRYGRCTVSEAIRTSKAHNSDLARTDIRERKDMSKLSSLGHFLKGSSAALGVSKVKLSCERIQHHGALKDEAGTKDIEEDVALSKIEKLLKQVKEEYAEAEAWLKQEYEET